MEGKDFDGSAKTATAEKVIEEYKKGHPSIIDEVFSGMLKTVITCVCEEKSVTFFPFLALTLPCASSLEECIEEYLKTETKLEYSCDHCKQKTNKATKGYSFVMLPDVLIIHLHRFSVHMDKRKGLLMKKNDEHISFPVDLDLDDFVDQNTKGTKRS